MSWWVCCNACFVSPSAERQLALTSCGHVVCRVCYQRGKPDTCLICGTRCQISALSDKSSSEVKALFSDISSVATRHLTEIIKVTTFQARHQKRLMTHYQQENYKLEEMLAKMSREMQQMANKTSEQAAYVSKLEQSLQYQSVKGSLVSPMSHTPHGHKPALLIPYNSPMSRHSPASSVAEHSDMDERSLFRKPGTAPRLSLISPPRDGRMGTVPPRSSQHNTLSTHSVRSATVSRFQATPVTPGSSYGHSPAWKSPLFQRTPSFRHSTSSLLQPPP